MVRVPRWHARIRLSETLRCVASSTCPFCAAAHSLGGSTNSQCPLHRGGVCVALEVVRAGRDVELQLLIDRAHLKIRLSEALTLGVTPIEDMKIVDDATVLIAERNSDRSRSGCERSRAQCRVSRDQRNRSRPALPDCRLARLLESQPRSWCRSQERA